MLWVPLAFALSCSSGADPAESRDANGTTSQPWYSTDPYNQHGKITCGAVHDANPWANSVGLGAAFWPCDQTNYLLFHTYGGALVSGNVDTDRQVPVHGIL
jgi:hypothetical protein